MKKVLRKSISILLSCIMVLSCMSVVSMAAEPSVTVIKGPNPSYERIIYTGATSCSDIGKVRFNLSLDDGWQEIKVTDSVGTELFKATDASELSLSADKASYFFGFSASLIPNIGSEVLTLSVKYSDEYTYTESYNVYTYAAYANLALDMNGATDFSASGLGLNTNLDSASAKSSSYGALTSELVDGFGGKAPDDKAFKFTNLGQTVSFLSRVITAGIVGDYVVEYDVYFDKAMEAGISVVGPKSSGVWPEISISRPAIPQEYANTWVTLRFAFDSDAKTMTQYIVKDGEVVYTYDSVDISSKTTLADENGNLKVYGYRINFRTPSYNAGRINCIDNIKMMRPISDKADISYTNSNGTFAANNNIVSDDASSVAFTLDSSFVGLGDAYIEKADGTDAGAALVGEANVLTLSSKLDVGKYNLVIPSSSNIIEDGISLGGNMSIPFEAANIGDVLASGITVTAPAKVNAGKVLTVGVSLAEQPESASLYLGDTLITNDIKESNRYYIPSDAAVGKATIYVKANYSAAAQDVVKTAPVEIAAPDKATDSFTIDFEDVEAQRFSSSSEAKTAIGWFENVAGNIYNSNYGYAEIAQDEDHGKVYKVGVDVPEGLESVPSGWADILVGESYFHTYARQRADKKFIARTDKGKFNLDFDIFMQGFWGAGLNIQPFSIAGHAHKSITLVSNNVISGTGVSLANEYKWYHVSLVFDVDNMKVYGKFGDVEIAPTDLAWKSGIDSYHEYIGYYRIGSRIYGDGNYYLVDNIETGWVDSPIFAKAQYTEGETTADADVYFPAASSAVTLNFNKAYKALTNENVEITVNGAPVEVSAITYDADAKTAVIPTENLGLKSGDVVNIYISFNEIMSDDTYADEPVDVTLTAVGADGLLKITKPQIIINGKNASADFTVTTSADVSFDTIMAVYSGNTLRAVVIDTINAAEGTNSYSTSAVTLPADYTEVKCFVWYSASGLKPVSLIQ